MKKYFGISSQVYNDKGNSASVSCNTRKGYEFFEQFFGRGATKKKIPESFIYLKKELLKELLKGFWRGDGSLGCQDKNAVRKNNKKRRTHFIFCSTSKQLIEQIRLILLRFQVNPSVWIRTPNKHTPSIVNGKQIKAKHDLNNLSIYGNNAETLNSVLDEGYSNFTSKTYTFFTPDNKYAIYPIVSIT